MHVSNKSSWAKSFQEFKIELIKELKRHHIVTVAMLIFSVVGIAAVCAWSARKVYLSNGLKEQKINQTGLKALKIPFSDKSKQNSPQQIVPATHIQKPQPLHESPWALTATHMTALALGAIGLMALYYVSGRSVAKISTGIQDIPTLSKAMPLPSITDLTTNALNVTHGQCLAQKLPWPSSVCTGLVPYYDINLILNPISSVPRIVDSMASAIIEKGQCAIKSMINTSPIPINVMPLPIKNANNLLTIIQPISSSPSSISDFIMGSVTAIFLVTLMAAGCCKFTGTNSLQNSKMEPLLKTENQLKVIRKRRLKPKDTAKNQPLNFHHNFSKINELQFKSPYRFLETLKANYDKTTKVQPPRKIIIAPILSTERQLSIVSNNVKFTRVNPSKEIDLYNCLRVDFNKINILDDYEIPDDKKIDGLEIETRSHLLAWVGIGLAKLELIQKFNDLTPEGIDKLEFTATFQQIGKQYKKLIPKFHPDHGGDQELSKQLVDHWKTTFVDTITRIYNKGKLNDQQVLFSTNTDALIELDHKVDHFQEEFTSLFTPQLIREACKNVEHEFRIESIPEESSSDDSEIALDSVELGFLKSTLIEELNKLTPIDTEKLTESATFQDIGIHYQNIQIGYAEDEEKFNALGKCWQTEFIDAINEMFVVSPFKNQNSTINDILMDLDEHLSKSEQKVQNLGPYSDDDTTHNDGSSSYGDYTSNDDSSSYADSSSNDGSSSYDDSI